MKKTETNVTKTAKSPNPKQMNAQNSGAGKSPVMEQLSGKWKQHVGAAKIAWGKLTEDQLLKTEGHSQKLSGLVQEKYSITKEEADKQVKKFTDKHSH